MKFFGPPLSYAHEILPILVDPFRQISAAMNKALKRVVILTELNSPYRFSKR